MLKKTKKWIPFMIVTIASLLILPFYSATFAHSGTGQVEEPILIDYEHDEWIIKWNELFSKPDTSELTVLHEDLERKLLLVKLEKSVDKEKWYREWSSKEEVVYIEPNITLKINAIPDDSSYAKQSHLPLIRAQEAWDIQKSSKKIVAVLDTGIDLSHPDLKDNLVKGINLVNPKRSPQDDNGHGTQVAGVLGAKGNNNQGITGVLWSVRIMPVKVLDKEGEGKPFTVSQGIYEAVDKGVSIILLSLGDPIYTKTLQDAVEYAESKEVLVVAATGNEGGSVNYPAAFPTVLAVGAVDNKKKPVSYSNAGPEVSVVAPGSVYTTQLNSQYGSVSGTSMAAPQVAGVAALLLEKYPYLKPSGVRNHIYYTSQDVQQKGWDSRTGHGLIDVEKALKTKPLADIYEKNDTISQATTFPIETIISAQLSSKNDYDWYEIEAPYRGKVRLKVELDINKSNGIDLTYYANGNDQKSLLFNIRNDREIELNVPEGTSYISIQYNHNEKYPYLLGYQMTNQFIIYKDNQHPNSTKKQATKLTGDGEQLIGTFDREGVIDWFSFNAPEQGQIDLQILTDTTRIDPVIVFERPDGKITKIDYGDLSSGQEENLVTEVKSGLHYFRVSHYFGHKVNGEYYLRLIYKPYVEDHHEPNNSKEKAAAIPTNKAIEATISTKEDVDWYLVELTKDSYLHVDIKDLPSQSEVFLGLYNKNLQFIAGQKQNKESQMAIGDKLSSGTYYIKVSAAKPFPLEAYHLNARQQEIIAGFRDIQGHWAMKDIIKVTESGLVHGKGNYRFAPGDTITRAEVAAILQRLYKYPKATVTYNYEDLSNGHWAYDDIQRVSEASIMRGFQDGSFGVNSYVTRGEVAVILDRILFEGKPMNYTKGYKDVSQEYWAYSSIMRLSESGFLQGDKSGTFRPNYLMSRAEFVTLINRVR